MCGFQDVQHWAVLVLEESFRNVDAVVRRDADEILIERSVMDRAEAQAVLHQRFACRLEIAGDVRRVE
jgi:hypothetical protein